MLRIAGWLVLITSCYSPQLVEGAPCSSDEFCPAPQRCVGGGCWTRAAIDAALPADATADAVLPVDAVLVDAVPIDAPLPCMTDGIPATSCPDPVILMCGTACWVQCRTAVAQPTAADACNAWPGRLLEVEDDTEQSCAQTAYMGGTGWLGLVQMPDQTSPLTGWTWNGTRPVVFDRMTVFDNWLTGKPDDGGGEDGSEQCALMATNGFWDDAGCGQRHLFACER